MNKFVIETSLGAIDFIKILSKNDRSRVDRYYYLFEEYGMFLPSKYLKKISHGLWELRPGRIRLFLTIVGNKGTIVHGIYKKTNKTPKRDIELSIKRIKQIISI